MRIEETGCGAFAVGANSLSLEFEARIVEDELRGSGSAVHCIVSQIAFALPALVSSRIGVLPGEESCHPRPRLLDLR